MGQRLTKIYSAALQKHIFTGVKKRYSKALLSNIRMIWRFGIGFLSIFSIFNAIIYHVNAHDLHNLLSSPAVLQELPLRDSEWQYVRSSSNHMPKMNRPLFTANPIITPTPPRAVTPEPAAATPTPLLTASPTATATPTFLPTTLATTTPFVIPIGIQKGYINTLYLPISFE